MGQSSKKQGTTRQKNLHNSRKGEEGDSNIEESRGGDATVAKEEGEKVGNGDGRTV